MQGSGTWGGLNLPGVLAADHGCDVEAYVDALGAGVLEEWQSLSEGTRLAAMAGLGSVGEVVHLAEVALGASLMVAGALFYVVVLQGQLSYGAELFQRGALVDTMLTPLFVPRGAGIAGCVCLMVSELT
jgi:hypothetical protein